jgi:hypothetical protein
MTHEGPRHPDEARLSEMFRWFAEVREKESPFYARLCRVLAERPGLLGPLGPLPAQAHLPVLLLTSIHYLALGGAADRLAALYRDPGGTLPADDELARDLEDFVRAHHAEMAGLIGARRTQTNEVNRSAVIGPAMRVAARTAGGPIALVEVGASAGLNLQFDRFAVRYSDGARSGPADSPVQLECELRGGPRPPLEPEPGPVSRAGLDLDPVDVRDEEQVRWLRACLFPDQPARAARLDAAVRVAREQAVSVHAGDVFAALPGLVEAVPRTVTPVVMHTWVLAYLPDRLEEFAGLLTDLARRRGGPLLWLGAEWPDALPGRDKEPEDEGTVYALAEVTADSTEWRTLANAHDHGTWMTWRHRG